MQQPSMKLLVLTAVLVAWCLANALELDEDGAGCEADQDEKCPAWKPWCEWGEWSEWMGTHCATSCCTDGCCKGDNCKNDKVPPPCKLPPSTCTQQPSNVLLQQCVVAACESCSVYGCDAKSLLNSHPVNVRTLQERAAQLTKEAERLRNELQATTEEKQGLQAKLDSATAAQRELKAKMDGVAKEKQGMAEKDLRRVLDAHKDNKENFNPN